jgi:hypothetical protein
MRLRLRHLSIAKLEKLENVDAATFLPMKIMRLRLYIKGSYILQVWISLWFACVVNSKGSDGFSDAFSTSTVLLVVVVAGVVVLELTLLVDI